jgi:hypothetical protein
MTTTHTFPIVGAFFRPPAKAILEVLSSGSPLILRPEPDNPSDPNAIQVWVTRATLAALSASASARLGETGPLFGHELADILAAPEHHLGYIPRTSAGAVAHTLDGHEAQGKLSFAASGAAQITTDLTPYDPTTGELT